MEDIQHGPVPAATTTTQQPPSSTGLLDFAIGGEDDDDDIDMLRIPTKSEATVTTTSSVKKSNNNMMDFSSEDEDGDHPLLSHVGEGKVVMKKKRLLKTHDSSDDEAAVPTPTVQSSTKPTNSVTAVPPTTTNDDLMDGDMAAGTTGNEEGDGDDDEEVNIVPPVHVFSIPDSTILRPDETAKSYLSRLPRFIYLAHDTPFDPSQYNEEEEIEHIKAMNGDIIEGDDVIRYRIKRDPKTGAPMRDTTGALILESNARILEWDDGTKQLVIGTTPHDMRFNNSNNEFLHMKVTNEGAEEDQESWCLMGLVASHGDVSIRPAANSMETMKKLERHIEKQNVRKVKMQVTGVMDKVAPEDAQEQRIKDTDYKFQHERARERRGDRSRRERVGGRSRLTSDFLEAAEEGEPDEDEEEEMNTATSNAANNNNSTKRRKTTRSSDDDDQSSDESSNTSSSEEDELVGSKQQPEATVVGGDGANTIVVDTQPLENTDGNATSQVKSPESHVVRSSSGSSSSSSSASSSSSSSSSDEEEHNAE